MKTGENTKLSMFPRYTGFWRGRYIYAEVLKNASFNVCRVLKVSDMQSPFEKSLQMKVNTLSASALNLLALRGTAPDQARNL